MGQYYLIVNVDKQEYIHPHHIGEGLKLQEFGSSPIFGMCMATLLSGQWSGDKVRIVGDYDSSGLYQHASENYTDISDAMMKVLVDAGYKPNIGHLLKQRWLSKEDQRINNEYGMKTLVLDRIANYKENT